MPHNLKKKVPRKKRPKGIFSDIRTAFNMLSWCAAIRSGLREKNRFRIYIVVEIRTYLHIMLYHDDYGCVSPVELRMTESVVFFFSGYENARKPGCLFLWRRGSQQ